MTFGQLASYFAMIESLLAIGTNAANAIAAAEPNSPHLQAAVAHLDAFTAVAENLAPVVTQTVEQVQQVVKPPQV